MSMLNDDNTHEMKKLKAQLDYEQHLREADRALTQRDRVPLQDLLGKALEFTEHAHNAEIEAAKTQEIAEDARGRARAAWNDYLRAFDEYVKTSPARVVQEALMSVGQPPNMAGKY